MTDKLHVPATVALSLEAALGRAATHDDVEGLVLLGSTASGQITDASDYDLLVVLAENPKGFHVEVSSVEGRLTDVLVIDVTRLRKACKRREELDDRICEWIAGGRIVFDRHGVVAEVAGVLRAEARRQRIPHRPTLDEERDQVSYDLLVSENLLRSGVSVYVLALRLRELHAFSRVLLAYFRVRGITWQGEKWAVRHLQTADPAFLHFVEEWLDAADPSLKLALHRQAAEAALEPAGGLWPMGRFPVGGGVWRRLTS